MNKSQVLIRFTVQVSLKGNSVDSFYQMKCIIISLFFTLMMERDMWLAYNQEHQEASDDNCA